MIPSGNMTYHETIMNLAFEVDCRASPAISSPIVYSKSK